MCLDDQILNTYIDGELSEPWKSQTEEHLKHCKACADRVESLKLLRAVLKESTVSEEEIESRKERVLSILEKNHLGKQKKKSKLNRLVNMKLSHLVGAAAAYTVVFVGAWSLLAGHGASDIPISSVPNNNVIEISNITPVRSTQETPHSLNDYSLEQILQYLDSKGYDVDLSLKGIKPLDTETLSVIEKDAESPEAENTVFETVL